MISINQKYREFLFMNKRQKEDSLELLTDEELIEVYHQGQNSGLVLLVARYIELIDRKLRAYPFFTEETEDVKQEALISLLHGIRTFDSKRDVKFVTYASRCIDNSIRNSISKASAQKIQLLKNAVPIDQLDGLENFDLNKTNPEEIYIDKEEYSLLLDKIHVDLSEFEKNVLFCYLDGKSYDEISVTLSSSQKAVDNALQRAKRKLKTVFLK